MGVDETRNKGVHYMLRSVAAFPLSLLRDTVVLCDLGIRSLRSSPFLLYFFFFSSFSFSLFSRTYRYRSWLSDNFFFPFWFIFFFSLCLIFSLDRIIITKNDKETKQRDIVSTAMLGQFEFHPRRATKLLQDWWFIIKLARCNVCLKKKKKEEENRLLVDDNCYKVLNKKDRPLKSTRIRLSRQDS